MLAYSAQSNRAPKDKTSTESSAGKGSSSDTPFNRTSKVAESEDWEEEYDDEYYDEDDAEVEEDPVDDEYYWSGEEYDDRIPEGSVHEVRKKKSGGLWKPAMKGSITPLEDRVVKTKKQGCHPGPLMRSRRPAPGG